MKPFFTLLLLVCISTHCSYSQETKDKTNGLFYKISLAGTLTTNSDYEFNNDEGETFINLNGLFINNTFGYQFDERSVLGINVEYDRYFKQQLNFLPVFFTFRYNLFTYDDNIFIRGGYGKLVKVSDAFENGTMYKVGFGYQIFDDNIRNSFLFGLDFNRKRFGFRQSSKLSSVSIFLEFMLF